jgi:uncharacterized ubiquitin-like protein YukD
MITAVIITVKIAGVKVQHDMELPADTPVKELAPKLLIVLKTIESKLFFDVDRIRIRFDSENRYLLDRETLLSAGVWDGSVITVERVV